MMQLFIDTFRHDCTGDACTGDTVLFTEAVFTGSHRNPKFAGERRIAAEIIRDSYGERRQQHTFTLKIIDSDGTDALIVGKQTTRKARNVYRNGTRRQPWHDEKARRHILDDKHERGNAARTERHRRRAGL